MNQPIEQSRQVVALLTAIHSNDRAAVNAVLDAIEADGDLRKITAALGAAFLIMFSHEVEDVGAALRSSGLRLAAL